MGSARAALGEPAARPARWPTRCRRSATCASSPRCSSGPGGTRHAPSRWAAAATCSAPNRAGGSSSRRARGSPITTAWSTASSPERRPASSPTCTSGWDWRRRSRPARTCAEGSTRGASTPFRRLEDAGDARLPVRLRERRLPRAGVIVTPDQRTVAQLAEQLVAWGLAPERGGLSRCATRPATSSIPPDDRAAGLGNGDIFTVERR